MMRNKTFTYIIGLITVTGGGWTYNLFENRKKAGVNINLLSQRLRTINAELEFFDVIEGPEGSWQHTNRSRCRQQRDQTISKLNYYEKWKKRSLLRQFFSIPPNQVFHRA